MHAVSHRIRAFNDPLIPEMVDCKYDFMNESLFRFYRGTNHLFYEDLAASNAIPVSPAAWISGDLHLENFGTFKGDNRQVYFDLNDFDEAILAPALWEITRMATSILIAFDTLNIEENKAMHMVELYVKTVGIKLAGGKPNYIERNTAKGIVAEFLAAVNKKKQQDILDKKTVVKKNKMQILLDNPKHVKLEKPLKKALVEHLTHWLENDGGSPYNYKVVDLVFRIAGTGSLGIRRYAILLKSLNHIGEKYMLIDMKQATESSLRPFVELEQPVWANEAERIVTIQRRLQNRSPALLSTTHFDGLPFVMQEMQPSKDSVNFKLIQKEYRNIYQVVDDMGMLTASALLRGAGRQGSANGDDLVAFGEDKSWQTAVCDYAVDYSKKVMEYYAQYQEDHGAGYMDTEAVRA